MINWGAGDWGLGTGAGEVGAARGELK